ncbi:SAV_2336 N-terminal domain-related protein [Streptomyces sp. NPDC054796]
MSTPPDRRLTGRLAELITRLREAGWDPTAEEVAEAIWLARWTGEAPEEAEPVLAELPYTTGEPRRQGSREQAPSHAAARGDRTLTQDERASPVSLYAPGRHGGGPPRAFPVRAPAAGTLSGLLGLQRALRPLLGYRPPLPPVPGPLDEDATADLSARGASVHPVFGPVVRREAEVLLLMDASPTTSVWQLTFDSLRQTCEQLGAFRDVQALYLHRAADGTPLIGTGPERGTARLRPADRYRDTTGRRLTLLVSDCVGPLWQDGAAQRLLHRWSGCSPLAVVQPLPPRLWPRTALPAEPGLLVRDGGDGGKVTFEPDGYGPPPAHDALPVPVLLPTAAALGNWAKLLGGSGRRTVRGAAAWVRPRHRAMPPPPDASGAPGDPRELLGAFRASASPGALHLAVHLAAVPLVLPVIQLVQEAMLPDTGPMELAEVLLSGLLERLPDIEGAAGPRYAFVPGVQELLLQSLDQGAAVLVLKYLSEYVARHFGRGTRNFPALAVARLSGRAGDPLPPVAGAAAGREPGRAADGTEDELFAEIPARVVRWYRPERAAPGGLAEAERLLRQWWSQGDPQLLHQARAYAEAALAAAESGAAGGARDTPDDDGSAGPVDPVRARLVLGQVLHALAETGEARRSPGSARGLLHDAAALLGGGGGESGDGADSVASRFELAAVQHDLWEAERDPAHLLEAERTLRAMGGSTAWAATSGPGDPNTVQDSLPLPAETERTRRLRLGRVLLALARSGTGNGHRADEAAAELRAAAGLLAATGADERERCAALLDLTDALRLTGTGTDEVLAILDDAEAAAGESVPLRLQCVRERARVHREARAWREADEAYARAESLTERDSVRRCALLTEWGEMLLTEAADAARAEGVLREALTGAPASGPLLARIQLLLGDVLVDKFDREGFLPDLYEGCHLLEQAARKAEDPGPRARAWLRLGLARRHFPPVDPQHGRAEEAFNRALSEARSADGPEDEPGPTSAPEAGSGSVSWEDGTGAAGPDPYVTARARFGRGALHETRGRPGAALADYRAARAEWRRLRGLGLGLPEDEVRATDARIAALGG